MSSLDESHRMAAEVLRIFVHCIDTPLGFVSAPFQLRHRVAKHYHIKDENQVLPCYIRGVAYAVPALGVIAIARGSRTRTMRLTYHH